MSYLKEKINISVLAAVIAFVAVSAFTFLIHVLALAFPFLTNNMELMLYPSLV